MSEPPRTTTPLTAGALMRPPVTTLERNAHLAAAAYLMRHADSSSLVVISDDAAQLPLAIVTDADIAQAVADGKDVNKGRISDIVRSEPITVGPTTSVSDAAALMVSGRIQHLPVVEEGRLVGVLEIGDVCRGLLEASEVGSSTP